MTTATLNIGLHGTPDEVASVVHAVAAHHLTVLTWTHVDHTLVVRVRCHPDDLRFLVLRLCKALGRDAIAVLPDPQGYIVGPAEYSYGPFDITQFKQMGEPSCV